MSFLSSLGLNLPELIREYGYLFVFVGTMLEGETVLVLGMIAAQQGLLDAWLVGAVAMVGTYIGDLGYYVIGVRFGRVFLDRFPKVESKVQRIKGWIVRYDIAIIIVNRFLYGFRIAAPVALGMSAVPAWRFMVFNVAGVAVWTVVIGGAGYLFGSALEIVLFIFMGSDPRRLCCQWRPHRCCLPWWCRLPCVRRHECDDKYRSDRCWSSPRRCPYRSAWTFCPEAPQPP